MSDSRRDKNVSKEKKELNPSGIEPHRVKRDKNRKAKQNIEQVRVKKKKHTQPGSGLFAIFLTYIYKNLYILGAVVIRRWRRLKRRTHLLVSRIRGSVHSLIYRIRSFISRGFKEFLRRTKQPFTRFREEWRRGKAAIEKSKSRNRPTAAGYIRLFSLAFGVVWRVLRTIINHVAPIAAAVFLYVVISRTVAVETGIEVVYKNEHIGYIKNENEFGIALEDVESRIVTGRESNYTSGIPQYKLVEVNNKDLFTPTHELANNIITASSEEIQPAYAVYINNELLGAVEDGDSTYMALQGILDRNKLGKPQERVEFQKNVSYTDGLFPKASIMDEEKMLSLINSNEIENDVHIVVEGETLSLVASKYKVSLTSLKALNKEYTDEEQALEVGAEIYVRRGRPLLSVQNVYTDIYIKEIPYTVTEKADTMYAEGYRSVVSAGVPGTGRVTAEITAIDGEEVEHDVMSVVHLTDPIAEQVIIGTNDGGDTTGGFMWPGRGGYISCYVGGYPGHAGIDIAGTGGTGSPVYASASGTVIKVVWGYTGYGHHIIIDHGDGWQTLYAHHSDMYVAVGDYVQKGKIIGAVGATGFATGPHIHFEVMHGGQKLNPVDYVGAR